MSTPKPIVSTSHGEVAADELGPTLVHEHLFVKNPEFHANFPALWDAAEGVETAVRQLERAYDAGVRTVVDMTVLGQGRDPDLIAAVAARTRVNLVLATGLYVLDGLPQIVRYRGPGQLIDMPDPLIDLLESDVTVGVGNTGVRASLVKFACELPYPDETVRRVATVVAEVHRRTGVPIVAHTEPAIPNALPILELLTDLGVSPTQVVLAHAGDITDGGYLAEVAASGAYIGCDRFGMAAFLPDEKRADTVESLAASGWLDQVLVSHDCPSFIDHVPSELRPVMAPQWSYTHLHEHVLPLLAERGLSEAQLTTLMQTNPARLLARVAGTPGDADVAA